MPRIWLKNFDRTVRLRFSGREIGKALAGLPETLRDEWKFDTGTTVIADRVIRDRSSGSTMQLTKNARQMMRDSVLQILAALAQPYIEWATYHNGRISYVGQSDRISGLAPEIVLDFIDPDDTRSFMETFFPSKVPEALTVAAASSTNTYILTYTRPGAVRWYLRPRLDRRFILPPEMFRAVGPRETDYYGSLAALATAAALPVPPDATINALYEIMPGVKIADIVIMDLGLDNNLLTGVTFTLPRPYHVLLRAVARGISGDDPAAIPTDLLRNIRV